MELIYHGHSCIQVNSGEFSLIIDPFFTGNELAQSKPEDIKVQYILLTHGHDDHLGDTVAIAQRNKATIVAMYELPHISRENKNVHLMPDEEFQEQILQLGGTPADLFENKELANLFLPILRADYRLVQTYEQPVKREKLVCDITALFGAQDRYPRSETEEWKYYTKGRCHVNEFQGNHFFINTFKQQVADLICRRLDDN